MVEDVNIPYFKENIVRCLCPTCPVQKNSICVRDKMMNIQDILQEKKEVKPEDFPGIYCGNRKADCKDIETNQDCVCPDCALYKEYGLENAEPDFLYCKDGKAKK